tara:strand:+ start:45458 stop:46153 length:696 start_codon:yes stop_codon:yes gene_type:complete
MKKKLKEELVRMSTDIITAKDLNNLGELYERAKALYEKLAVLKFIDENLKDIQVDDSKNVIASKFETLANAVITENRSVPENNPHEEDIITPGIDTIKDMVSEMPSGKAIDEVLAEFMSQPNYAKNDKELFEPQKKVESPTKYGAPVQPTVVGRSSREIKVDLNDRLAFVKHLFKGSMEDYNRVISQLGTIDTEERSVSFIMNMVKPDYDHWVGKEEYVARFMKLIEKRFS